MEWEGTVRTSVTVDGVDREWTVAFSRADLELIDMMKEVIPKSGRRWDGRNHRWQITVNAPVMMHLCTSFEGLGAVVTKPDTLTPQRRSDADQGSVEYWEKRCRTMEEAADWLRRQISHLEDERDDLAQKLKFAEERNTTTAQSTSTQGWVETLFAAVEPARRKSVFRALSKSLHPDALGADLTFLQQQLNDARSRVLR